MSALLLPVSTGVNSTFYLHFKKKNTLIFNFSSDNMMLVMSFEVQRRNWLVIMFSTGGQIQMVS